MQVVQENPPFIDELGNVFRLPEGAVFTFGEVIYNPSGNIISKPLMKHEEHHSRQQGIDPQAWWERYLKDSDFRLAQEVPAYQLQYREAKKYIKDKNSLFQYVLNLANDLSSQMYGNCITKSEAIKVIMAKDLVEFHV